MSQLISGNLRDLDNYKLELSNRGYIDRGRFCGKVVATVGDTVSTLSEFHTQGFESFDLLVTSPPYGDNKSTIPYGQHAYLPLQWINLRDIDPKVDGSCLEATLSIDTMSIGGRRSRELEQQVEDLRLSSESLACTLDALRDKPRDRVSRVAAFYSDFIRSLDNVVPNLKRNAYLIFTVGNRNVGGIEIPNHQILCELLRDRRVIYVTELERRIHNKRMPHRNQIARMMRSEKIMIFRKTV